MEEISQRQYWEQVEALAKDITSEAREDGQDIQDRLHETIDGHEWIIYTHHNGMVMQWTESADAFYDMGCVETKGKSWAEIVGQFAFCALREDVSQHSAFDADPEEGGEIGDRESDTATNVVDRHWSRGR